MKRVGQAGARVGAASPPGARTRPGRRVLPAVVVALVLAAGSLVVNVPDDVVASAAAFFAVWAVCLTLLAGGAGLYRPSASYLLLFGLFHGGLLVAVAVRGPEAFAVRDIAWMYTGYLPQVVSLAMAGMAAFTVAAELAGTRAVPRPGEAGRIADDWARPVTGMACGAAIFLLGAPAVALSVVVALAVVEVRQGRRVRPLWTVVGVLAAGVLTGLISETAAQFGRALRPAVAVVRRHAGGEPFRPGVFDAGFGGWTPGSPVADGYHNLGTAGVVLVMAGVGAVLGLLDRVPETRRGNAFTGAVVLLLLLCLAGADRLPRGA